MRLLCGSINVRERPWASKRQPIDYKRCCTDRLNAHPECVAKLFAKLRTSNYRIRLNGVLNRCCAFGLILESILLILVVKIVLQHIPPESGHHRASSARLLSANRRHMQCSKRASLVDQLVGKREQLCWDFEAECLRGLHIDQQ